MFEDPAKKEQIERVWKTYGLLKVEYSLFREYREGTFLKHGAPDWK